MAGSSLSLSSLSAEDLGKIIQRRLDNRDGIEDAEIISRPLSEEESSFLEVLHSRAALPLPSSSDVPSGSSDPDSAAEVSPSVGFSSSGSSSAVSPSASSFDPDVQSQLARLEERLMAYFDSRMGSGMDSGGSSSESEGSDEEIQYSDPPCPPAIGNVFEGLDVKLSPLKKDKFPEALQSLFFRGPVCPLNDGWRQKDCWDFLWSQTERKKILKSYPPLELFNPKLIRFSKDDWELTSKEEKEFDATLRSILDEVLIPLRICASWSLSKSDSDPLPSVFVDLVQSLRNIIAKIHETRLLLVSTPATRAIVRDARGGKTYDAVPTRVELYVESEHKKRKHKERYMPSRKKAKGSVSISKLAWSNNSGGSKGGG